MNRSQIKGAPALIIMLISIAYRNIFRNMRRSILCIVAISLAVFFNVAMMGYMDGTVDSMVKIIRTFQSGDIWLTSKEHETKKNFMPIQYPLEFNNAAGLDEAMDTIKKIPGVKAVFPRITTYASLRDSTVKNAVILGIDMEEELKISEFNLKTHNANQCLVEGRYPFSGKNELAVGKPLAKKMGVKTGDKITFKIISSTYSEKYATFTVTGIYDFDFGWVDKNTLITSFSKLQRLGSLNNQTQSLFVYVDSDSVLDNVRKQISQLVNLENTVVKTWKENDMAVMINISYIYLYIIFFVFVLIASSLIINTIYMVIHERIKEIGMMGALGLRRLEIVAIFFMEAIFLSLIGAFFGALIGGGLTFIFQSFPIDMTLFTGGMDMPMSNTLFVKFTPGLIITGTLYGLGISALCTLLPSLKSAWIEPVEALRR